MNINEAYDRLIEQGVKVSLESFQEDLDVLSEDYDDISEEAFNECLEQYRSVALAVTEQALTVKDVTTLVDNKSRINNSHLSVNNLSVQSLCDSNDDVYKLFQGLKDANGNLDPEIQKMIDSGSSYYDLGQGIAYRQFQVYAEAYNERQTELQPLMQKLIDNNAQSMIDKIQAARDTSTVKISDETKSIVDKEIASFFGTDCE